MLQSKIIKYIFWPNIHLYYLTKSNKYTYEHKSVYIEEMESIITLCGWEQKCINRNKL